MRDPALAPWQLEPGEVVLWRERRAPPIMTVAIAVAVIGAVLAVVAASPAPSIALALACAAVLLGGRRLQERTWLEDYLITDRRVAVVPTNGAGGEIARDALARVICRDHRISFERDDGAVLVFTFVRGAPRLQRRLDTLLPGLPVATEFDPRCPT